MRLLVVNDDGPPSAVSPYIAPFVAALHRAGHSTVVVIPEKPLSWIGKAHSVGKTLNATSWCPASLVPSSTAKACEEPSCSKAENRLHHWLVVDGPPASCAQIGLFHVGFTPQDFDLVVSGPNHGRNAGAVYALSSGTVGGAMEAALCGRRAVALSFGSKELQPGQIIQDACTRAVSLIEELQGDWHPEVEVYNVNLPMVVDIASRPVMLTTPAASRWTKGGLFNPVPTNPGKLALSRSYQFRWAPDLPDIKRQAQASVEGEDLWASVNGVIAVTPLKANFSVVNVHKD